MSGEIGGTCGIRGRDRGYRRLLSLVKQKTKKQRENQLNPAFNRSEIYRVPEEFPSLARACDFLQKERPLQNGGACQKDEEIVNYNKYVVPGGFIATGKGPNVLEDEI